MVLDLEVYINDIYEPVLHFVWENNNNNKYIYKTLRDTF